MRRALERFSFLCLMVAFAELLGAPVIAHAAPWVQEANATTALTFKRTGVAELTDQEGDHLSLSVFEAPDGVRITALTGVFASPEEAKEKLEREVARSLKVIRRSKKRDKSGKIVGERAQIVSRTVDTARPTLAVLWTFGSTYHELRGSSVKDIFQLEKTYTD